MNKTNTKPIIGPVENISNKNAQEVLINPPKIQALMDATVSIAVTEAVQLAHPLKNKAGFVWDPETKELRVEVYLDRDPWVVGAVFSNGTNPSNFTIKNAIRQTILKFAPVTEIERLRQKFGV